MEYEELRHAEHMCSCADDVAFMDRVEAQLIALQVSCTSNGGSNLSNQPF